MSGPWRRASRVGLAVVALLVGGAAAAIGMRELLVWLTQHPIPVEETVPGPDPCPV